MVSLFVLLIMALKRSICLKNYRLQVSCRARSLGILDESAVFDRYHALVSMSDAGQTGL